MKIKSIIETKNDLFGFLLKLIFFLFIVYLLDFSIGATLRTFYFKQKIGLMYRTTFSMEKTNADILIFGSSRANHHYSPNIFEEKFHLTYYNVGRDGEFIPYHYSILKSVLVRYSPKIVILDIMNDEFKLDNLAYERLSCLLPYYKTHKEIREIIEMRGPFEKLKTISSIYPFNSSLLTIILGNSNRNIEVLQDTLGYIPLFKNIEFKRSDEISVPNAKLDIRKIELYKSFIQNCIKAHIKIYIICSPYFVNSNKQNSSLIVAKEIANQQHVQFVDFSRIKCISNNALYFADINHLNISGSREFSRMLVDSLLKIQNFK